MDEYINIKSRANQNRLNKQKFCNIKNCNGYINYFIKDAENDDELYDTHTTRDFCNVSKCVDKPFSRSKYCYGKIDKYRTVRRKADRHSHHRRRKFIKEGIKKQFIETHEQLPMSTSSSKHGHKEHNKSQIISNKKYM